jgi:hypothetical protein
MIPTYEQQKALAMQWKAAAPLLRKQRHRDIRQQNNADVIESLSGLSRHLLKRSRPVRRSGLVDMYKILSRSLKR